MKSEHVSLIMIGFFMPMLAFGGNTMINMVDHEFLDVVKKRTPDIDSDKKVNDEQSYQDRKEDKNLLTPVANEIIINSNVKIKLYIYYPNNNRKIKLPAIYFMHGGGYLLGKAYNDDYYSLARKTNAVVVSVEYRLAKYSPYPADLNDAYEGLLYIYNSGYKLGIDNKKILLMGESAGGGLAARVALRNKYRNNIPLAGQVLIYPMLDYRTGSDLSPHKNKYAGHFSWTGKSNQFGWKKLMGNKKIPEDDMKYFSPAMATVDELRGLPKTFIYVGNIDLFVNEGIDFVNKLVLAGVETEFHIIPGAIHAFEHIKPNANISKKYIAIRNKAIAKMLH